MKLLLTGILVNALLECLIYCAEYNCECTNILAISIAMAIITICSVYCLNGDWVITVTSYMSMSMMSFNNNLTPLLGWKSWNLTLLLLQYLAMLMHLSYLIL